MIWKMPRHRLPLLYADSMTDKSRCVLLQLNQLQRICPYMQRCRCSLVHNTKLEGKPRRKSTQGQPWRTFKYKL